MFRKLLTSVWIAAALAGCAAQVGNESPKSDLDIETDDALIAAAEGRADSASRPTLVGEIENHGVSVGRFSRNARYLAFSFDAEEGQSIELATSFVSPASLDTVVILYNATSGGRPSGASLAFNDDEDPSTRTSKLTYTAEATRKYVAVVRRYDRGASGSFNLSLDISADPEEPAQPCGGLSGETCADGSFCDYAGDETSSTCGAADEQGTCVEMPDVCAEILSPVCGCDNRTYDNACSANSAGVSVQSTGRCGAVHSCPATGIPCTPECPGSGRINGHACRRGNFDTTTCTCEPIADCRTNGCREGTTCQRCWSANACIPDGAIC